MTDIRFYFVVLIDIFYYGRGLGHTFGVRVDGTSSRRFLRFLSLTGLLAPRVVVSPYRAMSIKSALRDWLSVSYGMISTLVISRYARLPLSDCAGLLHGKGGGAATKGGNAEMVPEVYDSLFFPHIPRFPLRGNASKRQKGVQGRASKWHSIAIPTANRRPVSFGLLTLGHTFGVRIQRIQRIHRVPRVQRGRGEQFLCSKSHKKRTPEGVLFFHSH